MNGQNNPLHTADYQQDYDVIRQSIDEYMATTDSYIIDRICNQKDLGARIPLSDLETIIVRSVLTAFTLNKLSDTITHRDRERLEKVLTELLEIPEIKRSEKLSSDIFFTLVMLASKQEEYDFLEDTARVLTDWMRLINSVSCAATSES